MSGKAERSIEANAGFDAGRRAFLGEIPKPVLDTLTHEAVLFLGTATLVGAAAARAGEKTKKRNVFKAGLGLLFAGETLSGCGGDPVSYPPGGQPMNGGNEQITPPPYHQEPPAPTPQCQTFKRSDGTTGTTCP